MNPDTAQGLLLILFAALGIVSVLIFHSWNKQDREALELQAEMEAKRQKRLNLN